MTTEEYIEKYGTKEAKNKVKEIKDPIEFEDFFAEFLDDSIMMIDKILQEKESMR